MPTILRLSALALVFCSGCVTAPKGKPVRELLGYTASHLGTYLPDNNQAKIWVHSVTEGDCSQRHNELRSSSFTSSENVSPTFMGGVTRVFKSESQSGPGNPHDALAFEVFVTYLVQAGKGRVLEPHRHNYANQLGATTRRELKFAINKEVVASGVSIEDLCALDEAKKRAADKVLAYRIVEVANNTVTVHFRLSDVSTGLLELVKTLKVAKGKVQELAPGAPPPPAGKASK